MGRTILFIVINSMERLVIFRIDLIKWGFNFKFLLTGVLLFFALVPLMVHIFSINNYSDFIIENDRKYKEEILRSLIIETSSNIQNDNSMLVSDIIVHHDDFNRSISSDDPQAVNLFLQ
ncbi:MAG: hypothetical protein P8J14_12400, partial [Emcibacteraceae bacterium]|nr:hypothetical protein [Emcibacteraceae bacterium]